MNPHKVVKHPPCSGVGDAVPFLIWKGRSVLLQGRADAICERGIDEQTHRHYHQEGHNALGLFEIEGGGQKLWGFEEAKPAFCPRLPFVSIEHSLGGSLALVQCVRREKKAALLVDARLTVREPRSQSHCDMVDHLSRLGLRAWSPPLSIVGRGADGAVVEQCGLPACHTMWERLLGICFTRKRGPAQPFKGCDFLVTLRAPLRIDGALGLGLTLLGIDAAPALCDAAIRRPPAARAIPFLQRRHGRRLRLGQDLLGLG
jgi:hypothetical protein